MIAPDPILLDTNIVSYVMKRHALAIPYLPVLEGKLLCISFITLAELHYGAMKAGWGERRTADLERSLREFFVVPYEEEVSRTCARIRFERDSRGATIALHDAWIAACAVRSNIPLVTHDSRDFQGIDGLLVITKGGPRSP